MPTNDEYWKERSERRILEAEKTADELLKDMKTLYLDTIDRINKEIEAFYGRYSTETGLSIEDVKKLLDKDELSKFRTEAQKYYDDIVKHAYDPTYKQRLKNELYQTTTKEGRKLYSLRRNVSRLDYLKMQIENALEVLYMKENEAFTSKLSSTYEDTYMRSIFDTQQATAVFQPFNSLNNSIIEKAVQQKWLGENYSDRIWSDKNKLLDTLNKTFLQDVAIGKNPKAIASDIKKATGVKYSNCERLARTEFNNIANQATYSSYLQTENLDKYKYVATLDFRTSEICQNLSGKVFLVKEAEIGVNYPPAHSRCRSTTIPYLDDMDYSKIEQMAKLPNGDIMYIPSTMTYKEWLSSLSEKDKKMYYSERKAAQQKSSDKKQLAEYRKLATKLNKTDKKELLEGLPTKLEDFRRLKYTDTEKYEIFKNNARIARSYLQN